MLELAAIVPGGDLSPMLAQVDTMTPNLSALAIGGIAILSAVWLAVAYYVGNTLRKPGDATKWKRNALLIFWRAVIPAPIAAWLCVALLAEAAPYTANDYRFEWAMAFASGQVATAVMKKLGERALALVEEKL